jgi:glycosyltransferase involved in cell wall biosynthesis
MIKVAHVINGLSVGGAETMLLKLLTHMDHTAFASRVYTLLSPAGAIKPAIERLGIDVHELGVRRRVPNVLHLQRLARWLRRDRPDLVQTWMYHSDLFGGIATRLARIGAPVVWNIRNNTLDQSSRRRTFWVVGACARLSSCLPDAIVCCSRAASETHAALGYDKTKFLVIPNGFDLSAFRPNASARAALRRELGLAANATVIGLVARFDPQKDHRTFLAAAGRLHEDTPEVQFVLCGDGVTRANAELVEWIDAARLSGVCHLLGERHDIPDVTAALDIACSSSCGESFPNVIGEAMACGVPCVVTDVGDSAYIVGDTGCVIPPRDTEALVQAWRQLLSGSRRESEVLRQKARHRVAEQFAIRTVVRTYEETYRHVIATHTQKGPRRGAAAGSPPPSHHGDLQPPRMDSTAADESPATQFAVPDPMDVRTSHP